MLFLKYASFLLDKSNASRSVCYRSSNHLMKSISFVITARLPENGCSKIANRNVINRNILLNRTKLYCRFISKGQNLYFAEKIIKRSQYSRYFHTSERRNVHPLVWIVFRPLLKLVAVLTGRGFRKWWRDLPPNKRKYFLNVIKENKRKIGITILSVITLSGIYYVTHLEETPITRRKRFMAFNSKQLEKINQFELQRLMESVGNQILSPYHPATRRVQGVVHRILDANKDLEEVRKKKWGIAVIDSPVENAFVLPIGYVFVFTGMLKLCTNDDQLGAILSHEIAHCIQNHGAENVSFTHLLDLFSIVIIAAIWAVVPSDVISLLIHWLYEKSLEIFLQLPYNRKIEKEADNVGLQLAARACFDVRESSAFWAKMAVLQKSYGKVPNIEFLSTHPSHESRSEFLDDLMDEAIKLRSSCGCPQLRYRDPRKEVEAAAQMLELTRKELFKNNHKPVKIFQI